MNHDRSEAIESAGFLRNMVPEPPEIGLLTGTGLGKSAEGMDISTVVDYTDIPHFPVSTVRSHTGRLIMGQIAGRRVMALQGRFHLYEGYSPAAVTFPIRVMQELGVKILMVTNAAGGLNPGFAAGDIMIITDHINLTGANPLIGPNEDAWGVRFPDMSQVYDPALSDTARKAGIEMGIHLKEGVYAGLKGPSLETPAEIRLLRIIGGDAVGLSTIQEVIAAVHAGMRILGLSIITNVADPDNPTPASLADIISVADRTAPKLESIIRRVLV
jgi:purine-nucleoside phosphorylase